MDHSEFDLTLVLPHIARLNAVLNRSRLVERALDELGVTLDRPGLSVLVTLHMAGEPLRIGEIANRMQVVGPHVTRLLHDLDRRGLVRKIADPADQRARLVELSPDGTELAARYLRTILGWLNEAVADWTTDDRRAFASLLERFVKDLASRLSTLDDPPGA